MKSMAYFLIISSFISLSLITFAYRDFSLILAILFTQVFLGLPFATFLLVEKVNWPSKNKFDIEEPDQVCDLVNKFNINSK